VLALSNSSSAANKITCICRELLTGRVAYHFEYSVLQFKEAVVTPNSLHLILISVNSKALEILVLRLLDTGSFVCNSRPKHADYRYTTRVKS